jgi:hypothetical protein
VKHVYFQLISSKHVLLVINFNMGVLMKHYLALRFKPLTFRTINGCATPPPLMTLLIRIKYKKYLPYLPLITKMHAKSFKTYIVIVVFHFYNCIILLLVDSDSNYFPLSFFIYQVWKILEPILITIFAKLNLLPVIFPISNCLHK